MEVIIRFPHKIGNSHAKVGVYIEQKTFQEIVYLQMVRPFTLIQLFTIYFEKLNLENAYYGKFNTTLVGLPQFLEEQKMIIMNLNHRELLDLV